MNPGKLRGKRHGGQTIIFCTSVKKKKSDRGRYFEDPRANQPEVDSIRKRGFREAVVCLSEESVGEICCFFTRFRLKTFF